MISAFDLATGATLWTVPVDGGMNDGPAVHEGVSTPQRLRVRSMRLAVMEQRSASSIRNVPPQMAPTRLRRRRATSRPHPLTRRNRYPTASPSFGRALVDQNRLIDQSTSRSIRMARSRWRV